MQNEVSNRFWPLVNILIQISEHVVANERPKNDLQYRDVGPNRPRDYCSQTTATQGGSRKSASVANRETTLRGFHANQSVLGRFFAIFDRAAAKSRRQISLFLVNNNVVHTARPTTADLVSKIRCGFQPSSRLIYSHRHGLRLSLVDMGGRR